MIRAVDNLLSNRTFRRGPLGKSLFWAHSPTCTGPFLTLLPCDFLATDEITAALVKHGFLQMLERCVAENTGNADAADMVRRAGQALQILSASRTASQALDANVSPQPDEVAQPLPDAAASQSGLL